MAIQKFVGTPFPDPFPAKMRSELLLWGEQYGFRRPHLDCALEEIHNWALERGAVKKSWYRAIQGFMKQGWALRYFEFEQEATRQVFLAEQSAKLFAKFAADEAARQAEPKAPDAGTYKGFPMSCFSEGGR